MLGIVFVTMRVALAQTIVGTAMPRLVAAGQRGDAMMHPARMALVDSIHIELVVAARASALSAMGAAERFDDHLRG
ncbi:hypothetical protein AWB78_07541 [Caballeronia calidae]|uniref:Uncharacterized protein n=2 Tax=Caballeronia calidae TaxID=1777139 RepID=A0A158EGI0_9BURK|nr:hypothetical protein AWB78_07541 [Caballeronia calidae]